MFHFIDRPARQKILIYSTSLSIAIGIAWILCYLGPILGVIGHFASICLPFILGFLFAFILRRPVFWLDRKLTNHHLLSVCIVFFGFLLILALSVYIIVPSLVDSVKSFLSNYDLYYANYLHYQQNLQTSIGIDLPTLDSLFSKQNVLGLLSNNAQQIASVGMSFIKATVNLVLALVSTFYMLLDHQRLTHTFRRLNMGLFPAKISQRLSYVARLSIHIFDRYIGGSIIDSTIIGMLCFIGVLIMRIPYASMIGFIVGITNMIPVFGPFLGAIPVCILLLLINPWYSLMFAIFILVLQQFDGNILKPIVLGDQLGLSGFWILFSVTVGGGLWGVPGMFLGVPLFALIYQLVAQHIRKKLDQKDHLTTD